MRLWELEEGDEHGQNFFAGGRGGGRAAQAAEAAQEEEMEAARLAEQARAPDVVPEQPRAREDAVVRERPVLNGRVGVEHEGPLVLRLDVGPAREEGGQRQEEPGPAPARQQPQARAQNRGRGNNPRRAQQLEHQRPAQLGNRGRGGGRVRGAHPRQIPNQRGDHRAQAFARRDRNLNERVMVEAADDQDQLEDMDAAWVRQFVHLALEDNEHLLDDDG